MITFVKYLSGWSKQDKYLRLYGVFGNDLLLFLSVFQGEAVKIPPINQLQKMKSYCRIYAYLQVRGFTEAAYESCERTFGKKRYHLTRIVAKVERVLRQTTPVEDGDQA